MISELRRCASREKKVKIVPPPSKIRIPHVQTLRSARKSLSIAHNCIYMQRKMIRNLHQQLRASNQRMNNLERIIDELRNKNYFGNDIAEQLMIRRNPNSTALIQDILELLHHALVA